jgi:hypothetical protein
MYRMTCFSGIDRILIDHGFTFRDLSEGNALGGELSTERYPDGVVGWNTTSVHGVVEVTAYLTGNIFTLLGDITDAEALALMLAERYEH